MKQNNKLTLVIAICLFSYSILQSQVQVGFDIYGIGNEHLGHSISFSADGNRVAIGAPVNYSIGLSSGHVRIFDLSNGGWVQVGATIEGEFELDNAGKSVALSGDGNRLAIGSPGSSQSSQGNGQVQVYDLVSGAWVQMGLDLEEEDPDEDFGKSIALSTNGNRLVIGAPQKSINGNNNAGQVKVYDWINGAWNQTGLDINGAAPDAQLGTQVALSADGNRMAIIASYSYDFENAGYLEVFDWDGTNWVTAGSRIEGAEFSVDFVDGGLSLSSDGSTLAYGSPYNNFDGEVAIYKWNNNNWTQTGNLILGDSDDFGNSVALSANGNRVAVGAPGAFNNGVGVGRLAVYDLSGNSWTQVGEDVYGTGGGDQCGFAVALSMDGIKAAASAPYNDIGGQDGGHVRIYEFECTSVNATDNITTCEAEYTWIDGNTYEGSNNSAMFTLESSAGCDSIVTLNLVINAVDATVSNEEPLLVANNPNATYQWLDCTNDYAPLEGETNQIFGATTNGNYAVMVSENGCIDTSICIMLSSVGVLDNDFERSVKVFPNPTNNKVNIDLGESYSNVEVVVRNILGVVIQSSHYNTMKNLDLELNESGLFFIEVKAIDENTQGLFKVLRL